MNGQCEDCGLWKEEDGTYTLIEPSDCHSQGGRYITKFNKCGKFVHTTRPWQVGNEPWDLDEQDMSKALESHPVTVTVTAQSEVVWQQQAV